MSDTIRKKRKRVKTVFRRVTVFGFEDAERHPPRSEQAPSEPEHLDENKQNDNRNF